MINLKIISLSAQPELMTEQELPEDASKVSKFMEKATLALVSGTVTATVVTTQTFGISNMADKVKTILKQVYNEVDGMITLVACVIVGGIYLVKMFMKNPRSIDEMGVWQRRVIMSWLMFKCLGYFVSIGNDLTQDSSKTPWTK